MFGLSTSLQERSPEARRARLSVASRVRVEERAGSQPSLNSGQQVEFLLARVAGPYTASPRSTSCRRRSVRRVRPADAQRVVLDHGPLAQALRATMSLPASFRRSLSATSCWWMAARSTTCLPTSCAPWAPNVVIAVNVGDLSEQRTIDHSLLGARRASTLDAMMRANTMRGMAAADVVINVPLTKYGSLDWRRFRDRFATVTTRPRR